MLAFEGSGTAELIKEGKSGWLEKCGDFEGMINRLVALLRSNGVAVLRDSRRSEADVCEFDKMLAGYLRLYDNIIEERFTAPEGLS